MKRRPSASDDDDDGFSFSSSRRKRVKYNSLEHTLAHMTLGSAVASEDVDMWPKTSSPRPRMQETMSAVQASGTLASEPVEMDVEPTGKSFYFLTHSRCQR